MYRWNKFRWGLESKFMGYVGPWEKWMINEFGNCTDDDSDGEFGSKESANQTKNLDMNASNNEGCVGEDDSNDDSEEDPEEDM